MKISKTCVCGNEFYTTQYKLDHGRGKFCSQTCRDISYIGRKLLPDTLKKISEKLSGKNHPQYGKPMTEKQRNALMASRIGKSSWNKNRKCPEISERQRGEKCVLYGRFGPDSIHWKGGITRFRKSLWGNMRMKEWRVRVLERDGYRCQKCDCVSDLIVHHIIPLRKIISQYNLKTMNDAIDCGLLWDINNGQTLCHQHHEKIDKYFGVWKSR